MGKREGMMHPGLGSADGRIGFSFGVKWISVVSSEELVTASLGDMGLC
jgi:hypothetical protein